MMPYPYHAVDVLVRHRQSQRSNLVAWMKSDKERNLDGVLLKVRS